MIGHKGHPEVEGTMGQLERGIHLVEDVDDVDRVEIASGQPLAVVTQTTLSVDDAAEIMTRTILLLSATLFSAAPDLVAAERGTPAEAKAMISVVAKSYGIHPQTLRLYEREGLLKPSRTEGNTRLYSDDDLKQLEVILNLTRDLGVNLAGIEIILNMRRKMAQMQADLNEFLSHVREELRRGDAQGASDKLEQALVKVPPAVLVKSPDKP